MERSQMKKCSLVLIWSLVAYLSYDVAFARSQTLITGQDPEEVQENAFKQKMDYPVGPLKCSQRCSQWWVRE